MYQTAKKQERGAPTAQPYAMPTFWYLIRGFFLLTFVYRSGFATLLFFFSSRFGIRHLEVPMGNGFVLQWALTLARFLGKATPSWISGIDLSQPMIQKAHKRFVKQKHIESILGDVTSMPFPNAGFDSINIPNGFHCFPDIKNSLKEMARVLKPGGELRANILLVPKKWDLIARWIISKSIRKGDLHRPYQLDEVFLLLAAGKLILISHSIRGNTLYLVARNEELWDI